MEAYPIGEDWEEILVRGTMDPSTAARYVLENPGKAAPHLEEAMARLSRTHPDGPGPLMEDAVASVAHWVQMATSAPNRAGWFRMNPYNGDEGYHWMLGYADGPGRGNFPGVLFDA